MINKKEEKKEENNNNKIKTKNKTFFQSRKVGLRNTHSLPNIYKTPVTRKSSPFHFKCNPF